MARRKRVIKKLRRAEVAAHRVARQPLLRHHRRTTGVSMQMATGRAARRLGQRTRSEFWLKYWEPIPANSHRGYLNGVFGY